MTITALVTGRLVADPERRTGASGKAFTLARIVAVADGEEQLASVIAFATIGEQLAELAKGDTIALTGRAKVSSWTDREGTQKSGLSVVADLLLTVYHLRRRRHVMSPTDDDREELQEGRTQ